MKHRCSNMEPSVFKWNVGRYASPKRQMRMIRDHNERITLINILRVSLNWYSVWILPGWIFATRLAALEPREQHPQVWLLANAVSKLTQTVPFSCFLPISNWFHKHHVLEMYLSNLDIGVSASIPSSVGCWPGLLSFIIVSISTLRGAETKHFVRHDVRRRAMFKVIAVMFPTLS